jgi:hypothetical protein
MSLADRAAAHRPRNGGDAASPEKRLLRIGQVPGGYRPGDRNGGAGGGVKQLVTCRNLSEHVGGRQGCA